MPSPLPTKTQTKTNQTKTKQKNLTWKSTDLTCKELEWTFLFPFRGYGVQSPLIVLGKREMHFLRRGRLWAGTFLCSHLVTLVLCQDSPLSFNCAWISIKIGSLICLSLWLRSLLWFRSMFYSTMEQRCSSYFLCFKSF